MLHWLTTCRSLQSIALALTNFWLRWLIWGDQLRCSSKYVPKYLTLFEGWSFFPHSFKFRSQSSCFFFLLKITTSVLATLREILLAFNHWTRNFKSLLTTLFICLTESLMFKRQVSSAKWKVSECFIAMLRSFMKIKKSNGPRTEPYWTPYFIVL